MSLRIGILGCGEHSEIGHAVPMARYAREHPGVITLAAACDLRTQRTDLFRERYGFERAYNNCDEMLAREKLDACIAVTPVEIIPEMGIKLLRAQIPCVVEKPLGPSLPEASKLLDAARSTRTPNMVSVNRRFMPLLLRGIEWAKQRGQLRYVRATMLRHRRTEPEFLRFTAIHAIDTLRFIAKEFGRSKIKLLLPQRPHWYAVDIAFDKEIHARLDVLPTAGVLEETYELFGDGFRVVVTSPFGPQRLLRCYENNRLALEEIPGPDTPEDVIFGFYDEIVELVDALVSTRELRPSIDDIFPSVYACFSLADQAESGASMSTL